MPMKIKFLAAILAAAVTFGQDLKPVEPFSLARLEAETLRDLKEDQTPAPTTPQVQPPQQQKKSRKKLWITLAVVGAAAGVTVWAVNKRLGNEGKGIF